MKKAYSSYDNRIDQLKMMDHVYEQFSQKESMVIEAGTGMGKTMGYLLPSAYYALEHNKRVIISTYTNQLQAQILYNEIPKLNNMLSFPIHVSILKGRTHYLDLFRFEQSLYENEKQFDVVLTKLQILVWLTETETGDVEELNLTSGGYLFWNRVKSSSYMIDEKSNPWYSYDYYEHAKKQATKANIVITNHHMLIQSLSQEDSFFADCSHYVIDEAHHLEEVTQRFLGANLSYIGFKSSMNTLGTLDSPGLYSKLVHLLEKLGLHSIRESYELDMALSSCYGVIEDWFGFIGNNALYTSGKKQTN
ncbi:DEAD/DEAH box helicase [Bacillus coahuilensis]|uniref:DEAD/DEAH box helicase n=1 Tax=Bacillus coahuilensis TaxID=408580 RepID=UPI0001850E3B|nr:DEAD/DEAH box helicase [Bacillus coahuilensis]